MLRSKRAGVAKLKATKGKRVAVPDPELRGHYIRITPTGVKSFWVVARDPTGKQHWRPIGSPGQVTIDQARDEARKVILSVRGAQPNGFAAVAATWRASHVVTLRPKTVVEYDRMLRYMTEAWQGRDFASIERDDVTALMDQIEKRGKRQANLALQVFSALANWQAKRSRHYRSPLVKGMRRGEPTKRKRILNDDELRALWAQAEANGVYGALIRFALLTAQRQDKLATMRWSDLDGNVWTIATEAGEKGNAGLLDLPEAAAAIIEAQPRVGDRVFTFSNNWDRAKKAFDAKIACEQGSPLAHWTFHDLRRTGRSLMSRAGVRSDIAERVMGHVQGGVEGIYDRYEYREEKGHAVRALAGLIARIVNPQKNVPCCASMIYASRGFAKPGTA
jgi:integrase